MDTIDQHIIGTLQRDARTSVAEIGRRIDLSAPAVAERIRKLESNGTLLGYHAQVSSEHIGRPVVAFVRLTVSANAFTQLRSFAEQSPDIIEFHRVAGTESAIAKVAVDSPATLEQLIAELETYGTAKTSLVLSSPVTRRAVNGERELK